MNRISVEQCFQLSGKFEQSQVGDLIVIMCVDVIVLGFAHPHLVLQDFRHGGSMLSLLSLLLHRRQATLLF